MIKDTYYFKEKYNLDLNCPHWTVKSYRREALLEMMYHLRGINKDALPVRFRRFCDNPDCINPWHYHIYYDKKMDMEDLKEIAEELDIQDVEKMGINKYLEYYNSRQVSDFLKISRETLIKAVQYKKNCQQIKNND